MDKKTLAVWYCSIVTAGIKRVIRDSLMVSKSRSQQKNKGSQIVILAGARTPDVLLEAAYKELDFQSGDLLTTATKPSGNLSGSDQENHWLDKGEWLSLGATVGVEKIFFVDNNPVIVFAQEPSGDEEKLRQVFNRIWCMARPRLLFLSRPGELTVYNLAKQPAKRGDHLEDKRLPGVARSVAEVQDALRDYRREQVETGRLFEDKRFEGSRYRADEALIRNLQLVRRKLITCEPKLSTKYVHALIGRSIFVRYLEDRKVLIREYFEEIAHENNRLDWLELLRATPSRPDVDPEMENLLYLKVLSDKAFTYALFRKLSEDFNGDMFPSDEDEENAVTQEHLLLLQRLLRGEEGSQESLFFFAYKFDVIPIELISSIYEEFYHLRVEETESNDAGSHYTPGALVEFLLAKVLTPDCLSQRPRVLDGAAGSGIFLVEAFRRMVRHRVQQQNGRRLTREQLHAILRDQIAGIEINPEAARVAAFSLCLALLHYQEPRAIRSDKRLPHLLYQPNHASDSNQEEQRFNILLACDTFDVESYVTDESVRKRFTSGCAHVVVGNPPWGGPGTKAKDADERAIAQVALDWCERSGRYVGDRERSQAFIHRTLDLLQDGGTAGLLVSTGVFFKRHPTSRQFRRQWLSSTCLLHVVNFAHVRELFFPGAIAPFASVVFRKEEPPRGHKLEYWSAKETAMVQQAQSVVLSLPDLKIVSQSDLLCDDKLWKVYWWGSHRDASLLTTLRLEPRLDAVTVENNLLASVIARGFQHVPSDAPHDDLKGKQEFPTAAFERYGPLNSKRLKPAPKKVHHVGNKLLYEGTRLLIKRGITEQGHDKGRVIARLEVDPFCFRNSIHGVRLADSVGDEGLVLLGIFWSSLARYFFFMTSGSWGMWHHELQLSEIESFPVRLPDNSETSKRILTVVKKLREGKFYGGLFNQATAEQQKDLEQQLDEAVFDLYELSVSERDLIRDLCEIGLDLFYNHIHSRAVRPIGDTHPNCVSGFFEELTFRCDSERQLEDYLYAFLDTWRNFVDADTKLLWRVIRSDRDIPMLAVRFWTHLPDGTDPLAGHDIDEWPDVLKALDESSYHRYGSRRVYVDGAARVVEQSGVIIVKRDETRLWTPSQAREDAEAALLHAMQRRKMRS